MQEDQKKEVAVFRFGVISDFVTPAKLDRGEKERLLREKCARQWQIPHSCRSRISRAAILNWIKLYEEGGRRLESLYPQSRSDRGESRALDRETVQGLIKLRQEMPHSTVHSLITEMGRRDIVAAGVRLSPTTVYRILRRHGLMDMQSPSPVDRRRFEAEFPNSIWQSDTMHGPMVMVGERRKKSYLLAFIDDMSRIIPHAEFYTSEQLVNFLDALRKALLKRGLPRKLYVDNGPSFRALHLKEITASLGIALAHSKPYTPQGRGKIERWFRTLRTQFLSQFRGKSLEDINLALDAWIRDVYHTRVHSSTGQAPIKRFASHMECIRPAPKDLEDHFRKRTRRRVANDRSVSLNKKLYEAPVSLIGRQVTLLYHEHDPARVEITLEGKTHGFLKVVDLNVNSRVRREGDASPPEKPVTGGKLTFRSNDEEI